MVNFIVDMLLKRYYALLCCGAVAIFTASRKHSHVAIFTATLAVNIAMWLYLRQLEP